MKTSDITQTIIILVVFVCLHLFNILSIGIKNIKENWPLYRCNPMIMPFSSMFGTDSGENFIYCVQNMQTDYMSYLMQPINFDINIIGSMAEVLGESLESARTLMENIRNAISSIVGMVMGAFGGITVAIQKTMINTNDTIGKVSGAMVGLVHILKGSLTTMESAWAGPAGVVTRAICFHPNTLIKTKNNKLVKMKDIVLGETLKNGETVCAVMKISNKNKDGSYVEDLYKIRDGENDTDILVTGSHLVFDPLQRRFIHVRELLGRAEKINENTDELSCLITSNHTIPIGKWLFHDWEDNTDINGKSLS